MKTLQERANMREQLVKSAKDATVGKLAKFFLSQYRSDLEHLQDGQQVPDHTPVGKDKFVKWIKEAIDSFYPAAQILIDNDELLRTFSIQVAEAIAKSSTEVVNPMKDYKVSKDPVFIKANREVYIKKADHPVYSPSQKVKAPTPEYSGSLKTPNLHTAPVEHSRYCPDHPGAMMRRVSDNVYQCPISGDLNTIEPWKEKYDYRGGHEVKFETGVQNQTSQGPNRLHPILPFLLHDKEDSDVTEKGKAYDFEKLYGVSVEPEERQDQKKAAELLSKITKVAADARMSKSYIKNIIEMATSIDHMISPDVDLEDWVDAKITKANEALLDVRTYLKNYEEGRSTPEGWDLAASTKNIKTAQSYKTQQLFGPTTMMTRQCPEHPGQQLSRLADNLRQCPLDGRTYDFVRGFTTEDGKKHNGGSVQAQGSIPPGSILVKVKNASTKTAQSVDTPAVHEFLNSLQQYLEPSAEQQRKILKYKFDKNVSLDEAIKAIKQAEELAKQPGQPKDSGPTPQQTVPGAPTTPVAAGAQPATASSDIRSFVRKA